MAEHITFWEYMAGAEQTKATMDAIPTASLQTITATDLGPISNPKNMKAVIVEGRIVASVSKNYKLVQHKDAFAPVFNGLHQTATPYTFALFQTDRKAFLNVFVDEIGDNGSGIKLGFRVINSIDGKNAISYDLSANGIQRTTTIELVGYRLVCQNGMKIRVPLEQAEELRLEKKVAERVQHLITMAARIIHMGTEEEIKQKMEAVQYVTEALALLKEPIARMIQMAKLRQIGEIEAKALIAKYVGTRMAKRIEQRFQEEPQNLWGMYNACTFVASHDVSVKTMNGLLEKSAELLEKEVFVKA
jgi:hypothetical protein